jgi:hypothetical protein
MHPRNRRLLSVSLVASARSCPENRRTKAKHSELQGGERRELNAINLWFCWRCGSGSNRRIRVLQTLTQLHRFSIQFAKCRFTRAVFAGFLPGTASEAPGRAYRNARNRQKYKDLSLHVRCYLRLTSQHSCGHRSPWLPPQSSTNPSTIILSAFAWSEGRGVVR